MSWLWRTPFFDGDDGFVLLIPAWLIWFFLHQDLCLTASQKHLNGLSQIFNYVKSIRTLNSLGSAFSRGRGIFPSTITAYHR
jgi:hypothetical protein